MELRQETAPRESSSPAIELVLALPQREALPWGVGRFRFYLRVRTRFFLTVAAGLAWAGLSSWIAIGWIDSLGRLVTLPLAIFVIAGIAIIPGYLNIQLVSSLLFDRPRPIDFDHDYPDVTLLIAAYNEEHGICETLEYALRQDYPGKLDVVVTDDGSTDSTPELAALVGRRDPRVRVVTTDHAGKSDALNAALATVRTPLVATIDADTLLMPSALRRAIARMLSSPPDTVAVAGSVLVRNSRAGALARVQEWDYFLAIASVKRQQALFQGTLVAQGAFSVYRADAVRAVGGWQDGSVPNNGLLLKLGDDEEAHDVPGPSLPSSSYPDPSVRPRLTVWWLAS